MENIQEKTNNNRMASLTDKELALGLADIIIRLWRLFKTHE